MKRFWGRVVSDGKGVADAKVALFARSEEWRNTPPLARTRSGEDGSFEVTAQIGEATQFVLQASAKGYRTYATTIEPVDTALEAPLLRVWTLRGTVTDAATRKGVADVTLDFGRDQVTTDAQGRYRFEDLVPGDHEIEVRHPGYLVQNLTVQIGEADEDLDLVLNRGQRLDFELVDHESGRPVAGALVELPGYWSHRQEPSDEHGRLEFRVQRGAELRIEVRAESYLPLEWTWLVDRSFESETIRLPMVRPGLVRGTVVDSDGELLWHAEIHAKYDAKDEASLNTFKKPSGGWRLPDEDERAFGFPGSCSYELDVNVHSSSKGLFELEIFPTPARFVVQASQQFLVSPDSEPLVMESARTVELALKLSRGASVHGKARRNGVEWKGRVSWSSRDGSSGGTAEIDILGEYGFRGLRPGPIVVELEGVEPKTSAHRAEFTLGPGEDVQYDFEWTEERDTIAGLVVDALGRPVNDALVRATRARPSELPPAVRRSEANGSFSFDVPAGEEFELFASREGSSVTQTGVAAGTIGLRLVLPQLGILPLRLIEDDSGMPAVLRGFTANRGISWRAAGEPIFQSYLQDVSIDEEGRARLQLPLGTVDLRFAFQGAGYVQREISGVLVEESSAELPVRLCRGADLTIELAKGSAPLSELADHLVFFLAENQVEQVAGPFEHQGGPSNHRINGINLWLADPGLRQQLVQFSLRPTVRGVAPGKYFLRCYPDDIVFEPDEIELRDGDTLPVQVVLRRR